MKETQLRAEVTQYNKENDDLRRDILQLQGEVYGARLAAKYLDKELAGRLVAFLTALDVYIRFAVMKLFTKDRYIRSVYICCSNIRKCTPVYRKKIVFSKYLKQKRMTF